MPARQQFTECREEDGPLLLPQSGSSLLELS